ncbi:WRKY Transcription Factor [Stylosanthes scabra]|uniref:WRKY Transcription Factor n=1 Tax=Stylosanthes scabra TaxID=79078 RepID=A0ABU6VUJ4_9FABA|nr:WRKY Transcription Factor [Stylosanthes scabra]
MMSSIVICGSEGNISLSEKRERVLNKLVEGHKHATELKHLLLNQNQNLNPTSSSSAEAVLISKILRSFTETLSDLEDSSAPASASALASSLNNWSHQLVVAANSYSTNNDLKSEGSSESSKRSSSSVPNKDRRGTYKRRKTEETWSNVSPNTEDDCAWRKYGQKEILNSKFPRSYYRCTRKFDQGCKATKQVQRIQDNPVLYQITYIGQHTCKESLKASQMTMMTTTNLLNPKDHHQTPPANAIIKQEDTTPSDDLIIAEKLDGNLWSDLKDFEITNPPTSANNNFGVFSSYNYCTTGFQFDDDHHDI